MAMRLGLPSWTAPLVLAGAFAAFVVVVERNPLAPRRAPPADPKQRAPADPPASRVPAEAAKRAAAEKVYRETLSHAPPAIAASAALRQYHLAKGRDASLVRFYQNLIGVPPTGRYDEATATVIAINLGEIKV